MAEYIPELLNELTRIVVTTRNDNPSVDEYTRIVISEWKHCQDIQSAVRDARRSPSLDEMKETAERVLRILRTKRVPEAEIRERFDEAFARCARGAYPVDRAAVESTLWRSAESPFVADRGGSGSDDPPHACQVGPPVVPV